MFDAGFYQRYYVDPRTRVASRADAVRLGGFVCAYAAYLGFTVKRVLDAGCGLGHLRQPVREFFPRAQYVGLETSEYLCRRYGWTGGSIADYRPRQPFDLVFCHDVLQYLPDRDAVRALANLAPALPRRPVFQRADCRGLAPQCRPLKDRFRRAPAPGPLVQIPPGALFPPAGRRAAGPAWLPPAALGAREALDTGKIEPPAPAQAELI